VATPKKTCAEDVTVCSASQICPMAIYYSAGAKAWRLAGKHVTEAKRRGLTCGVKKIEGTLNRQCQGSYSSTWDECSGIWVDVSGGTYIGKFKDGIFEGQGSYIWADGRKYVGQFKDSKNGKGFFFWPDGRTDFCTYKNDEHSNCVGKNAYDAAINLKSQFAGLPISQRKAIQSSLKRKGLYKSSIDGKWGRGTLIALVEFSSKNLGTVDLQSARAAKKILHAVLR
jgi:hypothetical protein